MPFCSLVQNIQSIGFSATRIVQRQKIKLHGGEHTLSDPTRVDGDGRDVTACLGILSPSGQTAKAMTTVYQLHHDELCLAPWSTLL